MSEATPELALPFLQTYYESDRGGELDMLCASFIYSHMIFPRPGEAQHRLRYQALGVRATLEALETKTRDLKKYLEIMQVVIEESFQSHANYTAILTTARFPEKGDGSLQSRAWQGILAGQMLYAMIREKVTLQKVAETLSAELLALPLSEREGIATPTADNLMKNYWTPFQPVLHFWAAMQCFRLPEPQGTLVRIDEAVPAIPSDTVREGWRGIVDVAEVFFEEASKIQRKQTHKKLIDPAKAFRLKFDASRVDYS